MISSPYLFAVRIHIHTQHTSTDTSTSMSIAAPDMDMVTSLDMAASYHGKFAIASDTVIGRTHSSSSSSWLLSELYAA